MRLAAGRLLGLLPGNLGESDALKPLHCRSLSGTRCERLVEGPGLGGPCHIRATTKWPKLGAGGHIRSH